MTETLTLADCSEAESIDLETILSRFKELSRNRGDGFWYSASTSLDSNNLLQDCISEFQAKNEHLDLGDSKVAAFGSEDQDAYLEWMKKETTLADEENLKMLTEMGSLREKITRDAIQLDGDLEALSCSLNYFDSYGVEHLKSNLSIGRLIVDDLYENQVQAVENYEFEIMELDQKIESSEMRLNGLQNLEDTLKRIEAIGQLQFLLSDAKVIDCKDNCIRLLLKAPVLSCDCSFTGHKFDFALEMLVSDHELLLEVNDNTKLKNVEIFPNDVNIGRIVEAHNSRDSTVSLRGFIRQVQHCILIYMLRRLLISEANKSRHSFEYLDRDETVAVHLAGDIDAFIKVSPDWPLPSSDAKLISIKSSGMQSKPISLSFLCKIKELANSLDKEKRRDLARFADAIEEILVQEMQCELHSSSISI